MPINIKLLSDCIDTCYKNFVEYYDLAIENCHYLSDLWNSKDDKKIFEKIKKQEVWINHTYTKNLQEIEWFISQQQPTANNLRFFLTVLISLKDVERCGDYVFSIAQMTFNNPDTFKKFFSNFEIWTLSINTMQKMWKIFKRSNAKVDKKIFEKIKDIKLNFQEEFRIQLEKINFHLSIGQDAVEHQDEKKVNQLLNAHVYTALIKIDRLVDHVFNIVENFYLIDHPYSENQIVE